VIIENPLLHSRGRYCMPSASVTTVTAGWERHSKLDWTVESQPVGVQLRRFVTSTNGARAEGLPLLAQALDANGLAGYPAASAEGLFRALWPAASGPVSRPRLGLHPPAELTPAEQTGRPAGFRSRAKPRPAGPRPASSARVEGEPA
jgi:hypothetical protein